MLKRSDRYLWYNYCHEKLSSFNSDVNQTSGHLVVIRSQENKFLFCLFHFAKESRNMSYIHESRDFG